MIARGDAGDHVGLIQGFLGQAGLYSGAQDQQFGQHTERAVRDFQAHTGAPNTGVWDAPTNQAALDFLNLFNPGPSSTPFIPPIPKVNPDGV